MFHNAAETISSDSRWDDAKLEVVDMEECGYEFGLVDVLLSEKYTWTESNVSTTTDTRRLHVWIPVLLTRKLAHTLMISMSTGIERRQRIVLHCSSVRLWVVKDSQFILPALSCLRHDEIKSIELCGRLPLSLLTNKILNVVATFRSLRSFGCSSSGHLQTAIPQIVKIISSRSCLEALQLKYCVVDRHTPCQLVTSFQKLPCRLVFEGVGSLFVESLSSVTSSLRNIQELSLVRNGLHEIFGTVLDMVRSALQLRKLDLSFNDLDDCHMADLLSVVPALTKLQHLALCGNCLSLPVIKHAVHSCQGRRHQMRIKFDDTKMCEETVGKVAVQYGIRGHGFLTAMVAVLVNIFRSELNSISCNVFASFSLDVSK